MTYLHKLIIGLLSTAVLMTPTPAKADWKLVQGGDSPIHYDPATIVKNKNIARFWSAIYLKNPSQGMATVHFYNSLDCSKNILTTERVVGYDLKDNFISDDKVFQLQPKALSTLMHKLVCKK